MGLSRYVDRQTAGVLRIASFLCYGSQAELDFIVIPTSSVYGNASESVLWVWWFRISLPWGILPATVPCSVAVRPEKLVISYVAFFIRLWTVISWLLFLPRWRFMFYFLKRSWRRYLVPRRLLPGKAFVFYSPVSAWSPHLGSLSPPCGDGPNYAKPFFYSPFSRPSVIVSGPFSFPVLPKPVPWRKERFRSRDSQF